MTDREMKELVAAIEAVTKEILAEIAEERRADIAELRREREKFQESSFDLACDNFGRALLELDGLDSKDLERVLDDVFADTETERCERLDCRADIEFKFASGAAEEGAFRGFGSVFNEPHETSSSMLGRNWKDEIAPGAFSRTLAEHKARNSFPAMLYMHDLGTPIGAWQKLQETDHGLLCEGRLALKTQKGAETYELMKIGGMRGLSIGFRPAKYELDEKAKLRTITEIKLFEISPVTIPADPSAFVTDVKARRD